MSIEHEIRQEARRVASLLLRKYPDFGLEIAKALTEVAIEVAYNESERLRDPAED
jgi:hypothetical protein